jgi:hypothetical protein
VCSGACLDVATGHSDPEKLKVAATVARRLSPEDLETRRQVIKVPYLPSIDFWIPKCRCLSTSALVAPGTKKKEKGVTVVIQTSFATDT